MRAGISFVLLISIFILMGVVSYMLMEFLHFRRVVLKNEEAKAAAAKAVVSTPAAK
jgi:NADH:ubiquinone oxidoreductase subunit 5 (subunit L)/multisubunit Na+/H+ antiporter MnhA subunit